MRVVRVRLTHYRVPFRRPYVTAAGSTNFREGVLVRLDTDAGISGLGESSLLPHDNEGGDALIEAMTAHAPALLGSTLQELSAPTSAPPTAWAGIETATWDARARAAGLPLSRFVSSEAAERVTVNALVGGEGTAEAVAAAQRAVQAGFGTVKLKVGVASSVAEEIARIEAVRSVLTEDVKLRLDANGAWSEEVASAVLAGISSLAIEYVEQPVAAGNLEVMRRLHRASSLPLAADEDAIDLESARRVIAAGAAGLLVLKPISLGGVGPTLTIAAEAKAAGVPMVITTSVDSGVGTALALHLAAALRSPYAAGLATAALLQSDLLKASLSIEEGCMAVPEAPGLGIDLDDRELARYTVRDWLVEE